MQEEATDILNAMDQAVVHDEARRKRMKWTTLTSAMMWKIGANMKGSFQNTFSIATAWCRVG